MPNFNCRNIKCLVNAIFQIGMVLRLVSNVKERSGFGDDYMSSSLMRDKNPRTPLQPYHTKLVARNFKVFFIHFILNCFQLA